MATTEFCGCQDYRRNLPGLREHLLFHPSNVAMRVSLALCLHFECDPYSDAWHGKDSVAETSAIPTHLVGLILPSLYPLLSSSCPENTYCQPVLHEHHLSIFTMLRLGANPVPALLALWMPETGPNMLCGPFMTSGASDMSIPPAIEGSGSVSTKPH